LHRREIEDLPKFKGGKDGYKEWVIFIKRYEYTAQFFSPDKHLERVRKALEGGEAMNLVIGDIWHPRSLNRVIQTLRDEFGRTNVAAQRILDDLESIPTPHLNNVEAIKRYRTELSNSLSTLRSIEANSYIYNPLIPKKIISNFPITFRGKWYNYVEDHLDSEGEASFEDFVLWFLNVTKWVRSESAAMSGKEKSVAQDKSRKNRGGGKECATSGAACVETSRGQRSRMFVLQSHES
jgi:hypothetical protein